MFRKFLSLFSLAIVVAAMSLIAQPAQAAGGWNLRLLARMRTGTPLEAKGDYRERLSGAVLIQKFNVEINGAAPNETLEVRINGNLFGTVTTNALGTAKIELVTQTVDDNPNDEEAPIPQDFPRLNAGDTISVGSLSGTFAAR
ncbi:MAG TPA: hypothetical protein PL072_04775 [Phycisphaerales bacterium]|nr:hypothetical protein [Phycisphaerales bacterium]